MRVFKRAIFSLSFLIILLSSIGCKNTQTLFKEEGKDWIAGGNATWEYSDGDLVGSVTDRETGFAVTQEKYGNYVLELDFKPDDYITSAEYLSLGEKKRMHLIRMYIEDKNTWIMDEPTASLNTRLRDEIWQEIFQKDTVLAATHDLSHLEQYDYVHYLEGGTIAESGSVKEVLGQNGPVREAYKRYSDAL